MTNFLGMRCPKCGDETAIDILASLWIRVCYDGTDADASENGHHEFADGSPAICQACGHCGQLRDFKREDKAGVQS